MRLALTATAIFWLLVAALVLYACQGSAQTVGQDAYSLPAYWQSYADYIDHKLYVPTFESPNCSNGVIYLGNHFYRVPAGVDRFRCGA